MVNNPICSMYGIFTYIWVISRANVGKYSIHGAYGNGNFNHQLVGGFSPPTPLKNDGRIVTWDDDIPNCFWKFMKLVFQSPRNSACKCR